MAYPIYGVAPISGSGAYGAVPGTPDPTSTATSAISGNIGNLANLYGLAQGAGTASAIGQQAQYVQNLPGYLANRTQQSSDIGSELAGQIPQDVINLLRQQSAELTTGTGQGAGAPFTMAEYEKAIGTNSLAQIQKGMTNLNEQIQTTPTGPAFNPSTMLVTPQQEQEAAVQASTMNAAPNPTAAAEANLLAQQQAAQAAQQAAGTTGTAGTGGYRITGSQGGGGTAGTAGTAGTTAGTAGVMGAGNYGATGSPGQAGLRAGTTGQTGAQTGGWTGGYPSGSVPGTAAGYDTNGNLWIDIGNGQIQNQTTGETSTIGGVGGLGGGLGGNLGGGTQTGGFYAGPNIPVWQQLGFPDQQSYDDFMMGGYVDTSSGTSPAGGWDPLDPANYDPTTGDPLWG